MTVDHYNESWLEHILTQKLSKELGNERESSGKIESLSFIKITDFWTIKWTEIGSPIPLEEKEQKQREKWWVKSFYHQAHVRVLVLCNHQKNIIYISYKYLIVYF